MVARAARRSGGVMIQAIRAGLAAGTRRLSPSSLLRIRTVRRFARRQDGAAAVEFGMVAAPFLALMFAIMETAFLFFASQTLETAAADSARLIMTGQAQQASFTEAQFKSAVCARILALFDCQNGIKIDVKTYSNFSSISTAKPVDADGNLLTNFGYAPGNACDIVVARLMYEWPISLSLFAFNLADMPGGKRLIVATSAFRNEPFGTGSC
jgi:Flp pilus assembly protein TadG